MMCEEHAFERAAFASSFGAADELTIVVVVERAEAVE